MGEITCKVGGRLVTAVRVQECEKEGISGEKRGNNNMSNGCRKNKNKTLITYVRNTTLKTRSSTT